MSDDYYIAGSDSSGAAKKQERPSRRKPAKKRPFWIELPILIVIAFGLTFLIQTFVAKVYYVPSGSMETTLHGAPNGGDRILANKIVYDLREPKQGDVVVFAGPETWAPEARIAGPTSWFGSLLQSVGSVVGIAPPNEKDYVKRVIAVGGQTVMCCDAQGAVVGDGRSLHLRADRVHSRAVGLHHDPDGPALRRSGYRAGRAALGDGRPPVRLGR